ncbi:sigma-E factor regulatory protein RseB domain-containing protein [Tissierella sp. Yu-01]|uniref:LolA family protein n=1 Tax=Tissierella sp. Yu-01 TaxID=3035694 RepID=UPI00240D4A04|nr:sigma-E factor regulatory protein RseB domain-containing protein [Tissierella sp. Yu-01]WFA09014.1 sigma-E factor regulatory protein RseB domain-containing protein [Tissierella sp. Yu-01]
MNDNEKRLSDFIDSLNNEKKPDAISDSGELDRLFNVVRQVRTLKEIEMPDKDFAGRISDNINNRRPINKGRKRIWIGGLASIAAVLVIAVMMNFILPLSNTNIVYAMEQAYNEINAYHGILEVISKNEAGEEQLQSKLDVWIDKAGNYYVEVLEGSHKGVITVKNEEKMWQISDEKNQVSIFPAFPETYEFIFELGKEIEDARNAESTNIIGDDSIAGIPSYIMEVTPKGGLPYKLWIDKDTNLPLQKQGSMQNSIQYITRYTEIDAIDAIPEELVEYNLPEGYKEVNVDVTEFTGTIEDVIVDGNIDTETKPDVEVDVNLEIQKANQISVDSGSSPWMLDPVYVAQIFISMEISPEGIVGDYPINYEDLVIVDNDEINAAIELNSEKTDITRVYLGRLVRQDTTGIWTVIGYDVK